MSGFEEQEDEGPIEVHHIVFRCTCGKQCEVSYQAWTCGDNLDYWCPVCGAYYKKACRIKDEQTLMSMYAYGPFSWTGPIEAPDLERVEAALKQIVAQPGTEVWMASTEHKRISQQRFLDEYPMWSEEQ